MELKAKPATRNKDFTSSIEVKASPEYAFKMIRDFRAWWSEDIEGNADRPGESFFYHYKDIHLCKIKLIEAIDGRRLVYEVLENEFNFVKDKTEWIGTRLIFEISENGGKTTIIFTHKGLVPEYECYQVCEDAWTTYIQESLYQLVETGKGQPNPKDKDGINAALAEKWKLN